MKYRNPIIAGFAADPSVCAANGVYYMVHSTFEYLPGMPISKSNDLIHWQIIGHAIHRKEQMEFPGVKCSEGLFAPTIRYHNGKFYVVCTSVGGTGNFYVTADRPEGPWSAPVKVAQNGIDPSLLFDDDDKVYFTSNGWQEENGHTIAYIQQAEIDIETGNLLTETRRICYGTGGRCLESPHLYHIGSYYYLFCAEGGTDLRHMVTVFRSSSPWGPFESHPKNPILTAKDENAPVLSATGHADLLTDNSGEDWLVFLCYRTVGKYHHLGRETSMVPVCWKDGWPYAEGGKAPAALIETDRPGPETPADTAVWEKDAFMEQRCLGLHWTFLREFFQGYRLDEEGLTLYGNQHTLAETATPAWIGRRQQHFNMKCTAVLRADVHDDALAGLSVLCSNRAWYAVMLGIREDKRSVILQKQVEDMKTETYVVLPDRLQASAEPIELYVASDPYQYQFGFVLNGEHCQVGSGMAKLLSTEVNWGFTGVFIGMYAVQTDAVFLSFDYCGKD